MAFELCTVFSVCSFVFAVYTSTVIITNLGSKYNNCSYLLCSHNCARHKFNSAFKPEVQSQYSLFSLFITYLVLLSRPSALAKE